MVRRWGTRFLARGLNRAMDDAIRIRGARQHNLKNIDLDLPRRTLTVVTGTVGLRASRRSPSTRSSRRGRGATWRVFPPTPSSSSTAWRSPTSTAVEGVSPAVSIEQRNPTKTSRSTVGTATEVYDYLRLLWARVGHTHCPECDRRVRPDTVSGGGGPVSSSSTKETRFVVGFPLSAERTGCPRPRGREPQDTRGSCGVWSGRGLHRPVRTTRRPTPESLGIDVTEVDDLVVVVDRLTVKLGVGGA